MASGSFPSDDFDAPPLETGEVVAETYRVESLLGRGGMGAVYAAKDLPRGRSVAIKAIRNVSDPANVARFEREARALAAMKSDHVVRVLDVGTTDGGTSYMVMERLFGDALSDVISRGQLPVERAVAIACDICDALREAHALGIVHRDLKAENVFIAKLTDGTTTTKLLDFGISKVSNAELAGQHSDLTTSQMYLGTPTSSAPELFRGAGLATPKTDVWSLGILLFQMLTGTSPYKGTTFLQIAREVVHGPIPSLRAHGLIVPVGVEEVVSRCLRKDPADRCTVDEARAILSGDPIHAVPRNALEDTATSFVKAPLAPPGAPSAPPGAPSAPPGAPTVPDPALAPPHHGNTVPMSAWPSRRFTSTSAPPPPPESPQAIIDTVPMVGKPGPVGAPGAARSATTSGPRPGSAAAARRAKILTWVLLGLAALFFVCALIVFLWPDVVR